MTMNNNLGAFANIFEDLPDVGFFTQLGQQTRPGGPQRRFFQNQFPSFLNEFKGILGQQLQGGILPTTDQAQSRFFDFLEANPFNQRFRSLAPTQRGQGQARFNAPTRRFF